MPRSKDRRETEDSISKLTSMSFKVRVYRVMRYTLQGSSEMTTMRSIDRDLTLRNYKTRVSKSSNRKSKKCRRKLMLQRKASS